MVIHFPTLIFGGKVDCSKVNCLKVNCSNAKVQNYFKTETVKKPDDQN